MSTSKIPAGAIAVCLMSHSGPEGDFREGARLRGDHPAVSANPLYFIEDGATDLEKTVEMQRRFPDFHPMTR